MHSNLVADFSTSSRRIPFARPLAVQTKQAMPTLVEQLGTGVITGDKVSQIAASFVRKLDINDHSGAPPNQHTTWWVFCLPERTRT